MHAVKDAGSPRKHTIQHEDIVMPAAPLPPEMTNKALARLNCSHFLH